MPIRYCIFDIGNTCYPFTLAPLAQYCQSKTAIATTTPINNVYNFDYKPYMRGTISYEEFCHNLCQWCNIPYTNDILHEIDIALHLGVGNFYKETLEAIEILKQHEITPCLLSNALPNLADTGQNLVEKDKIFTSYELGFLKPDKKIYQQTLQLLNTKPQEVIFIDDKEKNVTAAISLGINGIIYKKETILNELDKFIK